MSQDKAPRRALGRGLDALLPAPPPPAGSGPERSAFVCPVEKIVPLMPLVLPLAGGVLIFLLAFIAVFMA